MEHFVLQTPALQHVAQMKIVTGLWSQRDIFTRIAASFNGQPSGNLNEHSQGWKEIEDQVTSKISALSLPEIFKKKLSTVIKPIGIEVIIWCRYHNFDSNSFQFLDTLLPEHLCWSMRGTIDYAKTAELLVQDERVAVEKRYEIACLNCLEDEARQLFPLVSVQQRQKYITHEALYRLVDPGNLITFFTCTFSNSLERLKSLIPTWKLRDKSIYQYLFGLVLANGTRAAGEYFLRKVNEREKEQVLEDNDALLFHSERAPTCGIIYHLSLVTGDQRERLLFGAGVYYLLKLLFGWPMQPLFAKAAEHGWQLLDNGDCVEMLGKVIDKIRYGYQDYDYTELFWECWRLSSTGRKHYFLNDIYQLVNLFETKRKEFIHLCLNQAPSHLLEKLIKKIYARINAMLMDERVVSLAALMECKEKAALESSKDQNNVEKRFRSEQLSRLVDMVVE